MVLLLKIWLKLFSLLLVVLVVVLVGCTNEEQKECCLCNSFRYHAPCLIDLETGEVKELGLYFPHPTVTAELADPQPKQETFSLVRIGNVSGYTDTANKFIEIDVPTDDKTDDPALCQFCRSQLQDGDISRYILADLYDKNAKTLIPIEADTELTIRCYEITVQHDEDKNGIAVTVQGILE
jgi:hypothetical protein